MAGAAEAHITALTQTHGREGLEDDWETMASNFTIDLMGRLLFGLDDTHTIYDGLPTLLKRILYLSASASHAWRHALRSML